MQTTWEFARKAIASAKESQSKQADKHRKVISYDIGDKIWLSTRNIIADRPSKKLDHKMLGLFDVIGIKNVSVELQLPPSMKIHNVFHPNLLRKKSIDPLTNQVNEPPPPVIINNGEEWEVEDILDARSYRGKLQYRAKWVGWDEDREWYDATGFSNSPEAVEDFHSRYPDKPRFRNQGHAKVKGWEVENREFSSIIRSRLIM